MYNIFTYSRGDSSGLDERGVCASIGW